MRLLRPTELAHVNSLCFTSAAGKSFLGRRRKREGGPILPDVHSLDPRTIKMKFDFARYANQNWVASLVDTCFADANAVPTDFSKLTTVMPGYGMNPLTVPIVNNMNARAEIGLQNRGFSKREEAIADAVFMAMFEMTDFDRPLSIRRDASMMMPTFETHPQRKMAIIKATLLHAEEILDLFVKGELEEAAAKFGAILAFAMLTRDQQDKAVLDENGIVSTKDRLVSDVDYAISSGTSGKRFAADKSVFVNKQKNNFAQAARVRSAFGGAGIMNMMVSAFMTPKRSYLDKYAFTFKHRTPQEKLTKVTSFTYHIGADVTQHDQNIAPTLLDAFCNYNYRIFDPRVALMIDMFMHAPVYVPQVDAFSQEAGFWLGNPFKKEDFNMYTGLYSGIANNPDFGKWNMVVAYLIEIDKVTSDVLEVGVKKILRGEHKEYALLDMSDDAVLLFNNHSTYLRVLERFEKMRTKEGVEELDTLCHKIEPEAPIVFLGDVFYKRENRINVAPSPVSYLVNFWCPEYSCEQRPYWPIGWDARQLHYMSTPLYSEMYEAQNRFFYDAFGTDIEAVVRTGKDRMAENVLKQQRNNRSSFDLLANIQQLSYEDRLYLMDPSVIHYKVDPADLSTALQESFLTITGDELASYISKFYN